MALPRSDQAALACRGGELLAVVGMGDADERLRPLAERLAEQLGDAPFGDDGPHVAAGGDDAGARLQERDDARGRAAGRGRRQRDDGPALGRQRRRRA